MLYNLNKDIQIDRDLLGFKNILKELNNRETISEYIIYCKNLANTMLEIKNKKK